MRLFFAAFVRSLEIKRLPQWCASRFRFRGEVLAAQASPPTPEAHLRSATAAGALFSNSVREGMQEKAAEYCLGTFCALRPPSHRNSDHVDVDIEISPATSAARFAGVFVGICKQETIAHFASLFSTCR